MCFGRCLPQAFLCLSVAMIFDKCMTGLCKEEERNRERSDICLNLLNLIVFLV